MKALNLMFKHWRRIFRMLSVVLPCLVSDMAFAETWTLENIPAKLRPAACDLNRRSIIADRKTQTYKWALARKKSGRMTRQARERLAFSEDMVREMKIMKCGNIP